MKPTPHGWPRLSASVYYDDAAAAIDWLCTAFSFDVRLRVEDAGRIIHSELTYGDAVIMVGQSGDRPGRGSLRARSPQSLDGATTGGLMLYVDDADQHCANARAAGALIDQEPALHDYGSDYWADRSYGAADLEGHLWWFAQRVRG